ncbi:hypothetical protein G7Z17_g8036 [Cylindrodendrum hubeiense]|uniref:Uncharacterized protein n=1 Tax=Cylindrodendrum hubeiense TaxID=595255 RepID=A0A9P5L9D4_9HYPO|nr:hypothetical protein G7Z17_g8036 [Cylindrodendrum hubeiense]
MATNANFHVNPENVPWGDWTNWDDDGAPHGKFTMGKNRADLVAIFIGIFIVFVERGLWTLIKFFVFLYTRRRHLRRQHIQQQVADPQPAVLLDGISHQMQTVLQNISGSSVHIASAYVKIWIANGFLEKKVAGRTLPLISVALISFGFFVVAMPLMVAFLLLDNQGDQVLIRSKMCGFWAANSADNEVTSFNALKNETWAAVTYVDSCYEGNAESALCDRFLPQRQLPMLSETNGQCPFDKEMCLSQDEYPAFVMKTDVLDSHIHFGINSPKDDRVTMQRITTCAPLAVNDFVKIHNSTMPEEKITSVYFGKSNFSPQTYNVSNFQVFAKSSYNLEYVANGTSSGSSFDPISQLQRDDADISIILLNNNWVPVQGINGACRDPIFSATENRLSPSSDYFLPDNLVTAIGCTDQYIFGNPVTKEFTEPASWIDSAFNADFAKGLSRRQAAAYFTLSWSPSARGVGSEIAILGAEALRAKKYPGLVMGFQNPIPNDQWKKEVEYWFKIGLAKMQLLPINIAMGPLDPTLPGMKDMLPNMASGRDDIVDIICSSQKVHNTEFKNFHSHGSLALKRRGLPHRTGRAEKCGAAREGG